MAEVDYLKGEFHVLKKHLDYRFDELHKDLEECKTQHCAKDESQDQRIEKLEKRKKFNLAASAGGGIVGGFIAMATKLLWPGGGS